MSSVEPSRVLWLVRSGEGGDISTKMRKATSLSCQRQRCQLVVGRGRCGRRPPSTKLGARMVSSDSWPLRRPAHRGRDRPPVRAGG